MGSQGSQHVLLRMAWQWCSLFSSLSQRPRPWSPGTGGTRVAASPTEKRSGGRSDGQPSRVHVSGTCREDLERHHSSFTLSLNIPGQILLLMLVGDLLSRQCREVSKVLLRSGSHSTSVGCGSRSWVIHVGHLQDNCTQLFSSPHFYSREDHLGTRIYCPLFFHCLIHSLTEQRKGKSMAVYICMSGFELQ